MKRRTAFFIAARCVQVCAILLALYMVLAPEATMRMAIVARYSNRIILGGKWVAVVPAIFVLFTQWWVWMLRKPNQSIGRNDWEILGCQILLMGFFLIVQVTF